MKYYIRYTHKKERDLDSWAHVVYDNERHSLYDSAMSYDPRIKKLSLRSVRKLKRLWLSGNHSNFIVKIQIIK